MKKRFIALAIFIGALVALFIIARLTGIIEIYTAPTKANEPTILLDSRFVASNLKKPKQLDFIAFESNRNFGFDTNKAYTFTYRLIGLPGNIIEIKNGIAYVNEENVDEGLNLNHQYKVSSSYAASSKAEDFYSISKDSGYLNIPDTEAKKIGAERVLFKDSYPQALQYFGHGWTVDSFGPLKIPEGYYFVLGDNRHAANDSRFQGLIPIKNWKGTVLGKH